MQPIEGEVDLQKVMNNVNLRRYGGLYWLISNLQITTTLTRATQTGYRSFRNLFWSFPFLLLAFLECLLRSFWIVIKGKLGPSGYIA